VASQLLCRTTIEQWVRGTEGRDVTVGCSVDDAMKLAAELVGQMSSDRFSGNLEWEPNLPDALLAACRTLRASEWEGERNLELAMQLYGAVERQVWHEDIFDEREHVLAALSFAAWTGSRKAGRFELMRRFEGTCAKHVARQETVNDFLALPVEDWSSPLCARFFAEPSTLLAKSVKLGQLRNISPQLVAREAPGFRELVLSEAGKSLSSEESSWIASQAAIFQAGALRLLGNLHEARRWLTVAAETFGHQVSFQVLKVEAEYTSLALFLDSGAFRLALDGIPGLLRDAREGGLETEAVKILFLEANLLKALESPLAMDRFRELLRLCKIREDPFFVGLCLVNIADLSASDGHVGVAMNCLAEAGPILESAGVPWGMVHFQAVIGEVLRDQGHLGEAIKAYRLSLQTCLDRSFSSRSAYLRVLLSESLIAAGREEEAVAELIAALPVIERESLAREGVAAISLLKEALNRRKADPEAVRALRNHLNRTGTGGEL